MPDKSAWNTDPAGRICAHCHEWTPKALMVQASRGRFGMGAWCLDCKHKSRRAANLAQYELLPDQADKWLISQNGCCAICEHPIAFGMPKGIKQQDGKRMAVVDHDHKDKHVRGMLCYKCNLGIGNLHDEPRLLTSAIKYLNRKRIAICGPGRAGKDTVANWLAQNTTLRYAGSTSEAATAIVYATIKDQFDYVSEAACFADRHNHRKLWAECIWQYNQPYGITLYTDMLVISDILNGIRRGPELQALKDRGMLDLVIWIDRDVPVDPSLEMTSNVADIIIPNNGTIEALHARLIRISRAMRILK